MGIRARGGPKGTQGRFYNEAKGSRPAGRSLKAQPCKLAGSFLSLPSSMMATSSSLGTSQKFTEAEILARREEAQKVVQREGLPDIIQRIRAGTPGEQEKAVAMLSFLAQHDAQCAGIIVACGALAPLIPLLSAKDGVGDEDLTFDLKETVVRCLRDLCLGDRSNQRPIAERGACPPLLKILTEPHHPWSIREAAAEAIAILAYETAGGPAQESIFESGGVDAFLNTAKEPECTAECKHWCAKAMRFLAVYKPAANRMRALGLSLAREQNPNSDVVMAGIDD